METTVRLKSVVMAHPAREAYARGLANSLGFDRVVLDPDPGAGPAPLRTALVAWSTFPMDGTHQILVQDDVAAGPILPELAVAVRSHPDSVIALYANWDSRNGAMVRLAALAGASWAEAVPEEYCPTLALVMPTGLAAAFVAHARSMDHGLDDEALSSFVRASGCQALITVPNLFEHLGDASLVGNDSQGIRRAACYTAAPDAAGRLAGGWTLTCVPFLPYMRFGLSHLLLDQDAGGIRRREHLLWRDALSAPSPVVERISALAEHRSSARGWKEVVRLFGDSFGTELWIHCLLLGWQVESILRRRSPEGTAPFTVEEWLTDPVRRIAVSTIGPGALDARFRNALTGPQRNLLTAYAAAALSHGVSIQPADMPGHP